MMLLIKIGLYFTIGAFWTRILEEIIIKEEIAPFLTRRERIIHIVLWPISLLIFVVRFLYVFLFTKDEDI